MAGRRSTSKALKELSAEGFSAAKDLANSGGSKSSSPVDYDPYDEDKTELSYLLSKPTCFLVLGKPGSGKTLLATQLAHEWKCQLVNASQVISEAVQSQTESGKKAEQILLRGESIPEELAVKLIEEKIQSPEVAHHGYILDDFPCLSEEFLSIKQQLEFISSWSLKPDFIIYLKTPDVDLETRRIGQKVDPVTGDIYTKDMYNPAKSKKQQLKRTREEENEEEEEQEEEEEEQMEEMEEETNELAPEIVERLLRRPEDLPKLVEKDLINFRTHMLRLLEEYMSDHNQQHLFELDGNKPADVLLKETLQRLSCFQVSPAFVPIRLNDIETEEDSIPDDSDVDELFRSLGGKLAPSARFRWHRSHWQRCCPVALYQGNLIPGKAELAVAFLDKLYFLSSEEALTAFMKNPRPYLLPSQPRPPCKLIVTGPPLSGKTTLCKLLAAKYGAQVLNIAERMVGKLLEEKERKRKELIEETTRSAVAVVQARFEEELRNKMKEEQAELQRKLEEEERLKREAEEEEEEEAEADEEDRVRPADGEATELEEKEKKEGEPDEELISPSDEVKTDGPKTVMSNVGDRVAEDASELDAYVFPGASDLDAEGNNPFLQTTASFEITPIEVSTNHVDVVRAVEEALAAARLDELQLPVEVWLDELEEAISEEEKEMRKLNPDGPLHGGWILDNFPQTKEQWSLLFERNTILPDCIIALQDNSPNGDLLVKRWCSVEKDTILEQVRDRLRKESDERQQQEREKKLAEEKKRAEDARIKAEEERVKRQKARELEDGKEEEMEEDNEEEMKLEKESSSESLPVASSENGDLEVTHQSQGEIEKLPVAIKRDEGPVEGLLETSAEDPLDGLIEIPLNGPEVAVHRDRMKKYDSEWTNIASIITGNSALDPFSVNIYAGEAEDGETLDGGQMMSQSGNEIRDEVVKFMEKIFVYQAWERTANDIDEEEGDAATDEEEEEGELEEEEESEFDPDRSAKKPLGDTSFYCPVALKEKSVLWPGDPECAAKYREKVYYLSDADARERFLADPTLYLSKDSPLTPPPLRLLMLGPHGSGKSTYGRSLAKKLGLFHLQFRDRLQELVIAKTKKKIVPEREEEPEEVFAIEADSEDIVPIITTTDGSQSLLQARDGSKIMPNQSVISQASNTSTTDPMAPSVTILTDQSDQETADVAPNLQLTDEEEAIVSYLRDDEPLSADFLHRVLEEWWHQDPFKSSGFILEGFPNSVEEAAILGEHGFYPDAAVILNIEASDVLARLLPPKLDGWRQRRDKKLAHKQHIKERKKERRERQIRARRDELMREADMKKQERLVEKQKAVEDGDITDDDDEEFEEEDIEGRIAEEFEEEEEEEEEEETEEDASDRMKNDFMESYENDSSRLASIMEKLTELMIARIEIDSGRRQPIVRYTLNKKLKPLVQYRASMFERVYPISERLAQRMLQTGYKKRSRFGLWCPVKLLEGAFLQPRYDPEFNSFPVIHRGYIYFLSSLQTREEFMHDPLLYLRQPSPKPVVPIRMAIIGPPKSGKTTLAKRFAEEFGLMRLSIGEAIRSVLTTQPETELAHCIQLCLFQGLTVPDECAVQALGVALMDARCQTRGYILDGYPAKKIQVDLMEQRNIIPVKVIELEVDSKELANRATKDRYSPDRLLPLHDSAQISAVKLSAWQAKAGAIRTWYQREHSNWVALPGDRSKWWMWNSASEIAKSCVVQIQSYLQRTAEGKAANIADMCITPSEFSSRLGDFAEYCPVSLALRNELNDCSKEPTLKYATEFRGRYYKMAGPEELNIFLNESEKFVPPFAPHSLPPSEMLPKRRTSAEVKLLFPKAIELQGYCPVTFLDGKHRYEAIVPGDPELIVEYLGKLFCMETEEKLLKFMKTPEKYCNLKLPHKLPPRKEPMKVNGLPMLGYLEQTVAQVLTKALTAVGTFKPKYPFMSATQSALTYFALQLKAMNPNSSAYVRKKYERRLLQYEETCELISYLGSNMTRRYQEPKDRPIDFNFKLEKFMQLQTEKVNPVTWVS